MFHLESTSLDSPRSESCLQVLLFLTYRGPVERGWSVLNSTLNYTASPDLLAAPPRAHFTDFTAIRSDSIRLKPCPPDVVLSRELGEREEPSSVGTRDETFLREDVDSGTGRIQLDGVSQKELFITAPGKNLPYAVVIFPLKARAKGKIELRFVPDSTVKDGNLLADRSDRSLTAYTLDGEIVIRPYYSPLAWGVSAFGLAFFLAFGLQFWRNVRGS